MTSHPDPAAAKPGQEPSDRPEDAGTFERGTEEFARVLTFSDGVFAIAMTLLVVGIAVPTLRVAGDSGELLDALGDLTSSFVSFFISFAVIGRYWVAHHQFFSLLRGVDRRLIAINLVYLAFVAFLPFPTGLLGAYFDNPVSIVTYALAVAIVSGLEVVLFRRAYRDGLLRRGMPPEVFRYGTLSSTLPVVFFVLSMPVAFVSTGVAVAFWFLAVPVQVALDPRVKPAAADAYLP